MHNIAAAVLLLGCAHEISCKSQLSKTRKEPVMSNVTCQDRNFERTLMWTAQNVSDDLGLMHFALHFCVVGECDVSKDKVYCYDDERKNRVNVVNSTFCKTSVRQITTYGYDYFFVRGIYKNLSTNKTVRTAPVVKSCGPIEKTTSLSPPSISTSPEKDVVNVNLMLPKDLERTFNDLSSVSTTIDFSITYFFCVAESELECDEKRVRKSLNSEMRYPIPLNPSSDYVVLGWYTVQGEYLLTSEKARQQIRTLADPFPQWMQILSICAIAFFIILLILSTITGGYIHLKAKEAKKAIKKPMSKSLADTISEPICSARSGYLLVDLGTKWTCFLAEDKSSFLPIKRLAESEKKRMQESNRSVAADVSSKHSEYTSETEAVDQNGYKRNGDLDSSTNSSCRSQGLSSLQQNFKTPVGCFENDDVQIIVRTTNQDQLGQYRSHNMGQATFLSSINLPDDYMRFRSEGSCNAAYCQK